MPGKGRVSGRDEDKVAGAGLTVEFTELGNPIYAEVDRAIECKKLYAQQFDAGFPAQRGAFLYHARSLSRDYFFLKSRCASSYRFSFQVYQV